MCMQPSSFFSYGTTTKAENTILLLPPQLRRLLYNSKKLHKVNEQINIYILYLSTMSLKMIKYNLEISKIKFLIY